MRTALDAPVMALDAAENNFVDKVREHGWFATHVAEEGEHRSFTYTTGFWVTLERSEILIFSLKRETAIKVFSDLFHDLKNGIKHPVSLANSNIFGNSAAFLFPIAKKKYADYLGWSRWFYGGDDFSCLQLVWPDPAGAFPWQVGFDERFRTSQPDLTEQGWTAALAQ
jgi:Domain of unknown function (DUF4262)